MAVFFGYGKVPVRLQGYAGGKRHDRHVDVRYNHNPEQDLPRLARPLEGKEVDIEKEYGHLGEG